MTNQVHRKGLNVLIYYKLVDSYDGFSANNNLKNINYDSESDSD